MLKKTITYTDYNDVERTETFYFNISESELTEMQLSTEGGLAERLQKMIDSQDVPSVTKVFKDIILKAYGEKSADGKYFRKSEEISNAFVATEAYNKLYMELLQDPDKLAEFINGLLPKSVRDEVAKAQAERKLQVVE